MKRKVRFYKQNNNWYADVQNHTQEENEMVMGSDIVLETLSKGKNEVFLDISNEPMDNCMAHFRITKHDNAGAFYTTNTHIGNTNEIWICNVTHDVLGEHPSDIYIKQITDNEA